MDSADIQIKRCPFCLIDKSLSEFYQKQAKCNMCRLQYSKDWYQRNKESAGKRARNWVKSNPKQHRESALMRLYKLPAKRYAEMLKNQRNKCAICRVEFTSEKRKGAFVDHNHSCCAGNSSCGNCVRGLVCRDCNFILGLVKDDPKVLRKAASYLISYQED